MTDREVMQQALKALYGFIPYLTLRDKDQCDRYDAAVTALRTALAREHALHDLARLGQEIEQQAEPVAHAVIVGALFDFMGWLTTRKERLVLSSTDNASPAADAIKAFAEMRGLSLDDARVQNWQNYTTPPQQQAEPLTELQKRYLASENATKQAEPVAVYGYCPDCGAKGVTRERRPNGDDKCTNGHTYPSSTATPVQPLLMNHNGAVRKVHGYPPARPQQQAEPVALWQKRHLLRTKGAWENTNEHDAKWWSEKAQGWEIRALYTTPPQRQWVGLTDEEIKAAWSQLWCDINKMKLAPDDRPQKETVGFIFAKAIEAKLKEKNDY